MLKKVSFLAPAQIIVVGRVQRQPILVLQGLLSKSRTYAASKKVDIVLRRWRSSVVNGFVLIFQDVTMRVVSVSVARTARLPYFLVVNIPPPAAVVVHRVGAFCKYRERVSQILAAGRSLANHFLFSAG